MTRTEQFAKRHKLVAVLAGKDGYLALIDSRCLKVGQEIDGFQVTAVDRTSVTLSHGDSQVTLSLPTGSAEGDR